MEPLENNHVWQQLVTCFNDATPENFIVRFNEMSDELFINLTRDRIRDVSVYIAPDIAIRSSPDRSEVYGLVIENFLAIVAPRFPELLSLLDWSELDDHEIMRIRRAMTKGMSGQMLGERVVEEMSRLAAAGD